MPALEIAALWAAFAATHMGLSSQRLRPKLVARLGLGFQGVYSLIALAIFVPMVGHYFSHKHAGPHLWHLGGLPGMRSAMYAGMGLALVLMVGGLLRPSPAAAFPGAGEARGVQRITRHPLFMGAGLFGLLHLLVASVNAAELAFFGGFPLFAWAGCRHQDRRKLAEGGEAFRRFHAETGFLPFTAPGALRGLREQPLAVLLGIAAALLLRSYHSAWFSG